MRLRFFHILLFLTIATQVSAQISTPPKGKKQNAQQQDQIRIDEQLAGQYFRDQDYESAKELYKKLYEKSGQSYHFQQYIECCLQLKQYKETEKELQKFIKDNPSYHKAFADLVYVYTLEGKTDKAKREFDEIFKNLPKSASVIRNE